MAMARVTIKCSRCGKEFEVKKQCRNRRDADSFEEWAEWHIDTCRDCERELEYQRAAEKTKSLPALEGSEKQVRWATCIRASFRDEYPGDEGFANLYKFICEHCTKAAWWIDNQHGLVLAFDKLLRDDASLMQECKSYAASLQSNDSTVGDVTQV